MNEMIINSAQNSGEAAQANRPDGLYETNSKLQQRGAKERFVFEGSIYQQAKIHPLITTGILIGGGFALAAWLGSKTESGKSDDAPKSLAAKGSR